MRTGHGAVEGTGQPRTATHSKDGRDGYHRAAHGVGFWRWIASGASPWRIRRRARSLRRPSQELEAGSLWDAFPDLAGSPAETDPRLVTGGRIERKLEFFSPVLYNWFEIRSVPATDGGVYIFFVDVSDRARSAQSEAVQRELRRILLEAPVAISITRGPEHR